jgi:hypothetical protein
MSSTLKAVLRPFLAFSKIKIARNKKTTRNHSPPGLYPEERRNQKVKIAPFRLRSTPQFSQSINSALFTHKQSPYKIVYRYGY